MTSWVREEKEGEKVRVAPGLIVEEACLVDARSLINTQFSTLHATTLNTYCEAKRLLQEEQYRFCPHRSTTDMMFAVHRPRELGRKARVPLFLCFIDLLNAYDPVDRTLLSQLLARSGVPPQMYK